MERALDPNRKFETVFNNLKENSDKWLIEMKQVCAGKESLAASADKKRSTSASQRAD